MAAALTSLTANEGSGSSGPFDEQVDGVVLRQRRDVDGFMEGRAAHRRDPPGDLPGHPEGLAAGGQHRGGRIGRQDSGDEVGAGRHEVLTVVQDEQRRLVAERGRQLVGDGHAWGLTSAESGQGGAIDGARIGQGCQLDPPHPAGLRVDCLGGCRLGQAGLAHASRTGQRHQPLAGQQVAPRR
jgi:hypothetical protein